MKQFFKTTFSMSLTCLCCHCHPHKLKSHEATTVTTVFSLFPGHEPWAHLWLLLLLCCTQLGQQTLSALSSKHTDTHRATHHLTVPSSTSPWGFSSLLVGLCLSSGLPIVCLPLNNQQGPLPKACSNVSSHHPVEAKSVLLGIS